MEAASGTVRRPPLAVSAASLVSSLDRFAVGPLLVLVAADLGASLGQVLAVATWYYLTYGLSQPLWGALSDRFGRLRLMRIALVGAAITGLVSALAANLTVLIAARCLTGAFFGAIIPTSITFVGDTVEERHRQGALSDLMAAVAVGTALATAIAGLVGDVSGWRPVFALPAVLALGCALALTRLPEPSRERPGSMLATTVQALRHGWVLVVIALALVEGAVVIGVLTLLAPALQAQGVGATAAGLATATYGLSVIAATRVVKPLTRRVPMVRLMAIGGAAIVFGYAVVAVRVSVAAVVVTAVLLGVSWAFLHSSLQTWATVVLPRARGTVVSLFAAALFVGSSLGVWLAEPFTATGRWELLFAGSAAVGCALTVAAVLAKRADESRPRGRSTSP